MNTRSLLLSASLVLMAPGFTGCASNQALRASLSDRDQLIRDLREENQAVKYRLQEVTHDRDLLKSALTDKALDVPVTAAESTYEPQSDGLYGEDLDTALFEDEGISVDRYANEVILGIPASMTFGSGSASLSRAGESALDAVLGQLKSAFPDGRFFIEGHTDAQRIRRSKFASNRDLSYARARAVHEYLVTRGEIDDQRFVVVAHGPHKPKDSNDTEEGRGNNRRVEIVVKP